MPENSIELLTQSYLDVIEDELKTAVNRAQGFGNAPLLEMLIYHMGWKAAQNKPDVRGKRIRPLLVLLTCTAAGGDWKLAIHGATAVELVHNFSLIHDDIEDNSPLRRGRLTVWKKWGIPQAINAGDAMYALAHLEAILMARAITPATSLNAVEILQNTCLHLTHGQYLDLSYESRNDLGVDDYWPMVEGKTAALMAACTKLGALAAGCNQQLCSFYHQFGRLLGIAFQVQDDVLGIWGNTSLTGKSSQSDLVTGKLTLPVLFGLSRKSEFAKRWSNGPINPDELPAVIQMLEIEGGKQYAENKARELLSEALSTFEQAHPAGIAAHALKNLAENLVNRQS